MLKERHTLRITSVLLLAMGLASCHGFFTDPALTSIQVTPSNPSVVVGGTQQFTATGVNDDGSTRNLNNVTWSSGTPATATIDSASGMAKAVAAGTSTITATSGTISGNTTMTVTTSALQSITITASGSTVAVNGTLQFTATGHFQDGTTKDITSSATWKSSNTSVATITNPGGLATGVAAGTTTITASSGSDVTSQGFTLTVGSLGF